MAVGGLEVGLMAVVALPQQSHAVEARENKQPSFRTCVIRPSEQDADVVPFVSREEYYLTPGRPRRADHRQAAARGDRHGRGSVRGDGDEVQLGATVGSGAKR
jgi:replicative DNA helicase